MDLQFLVAAAFRGFGLIGLAGALGGLAIELFILSAAQNEFAASRLWLHRWIPACFVILLIATIADLIIQTHGMSRAPLASSIATIPEVIQKTHFGRILSLRTLALICALVLSLPRQRPLRFVCLLLAIAVVFAISLTSHASDWGDLSLSMAMDWTHGVAASAWVGGLFALAVIVSGRHAPVTRETFFLIARRFSLLAGICLVAVALTGIYNAWAQVETLSRMWTTTYGRLLIIKLVIVLGLVGLGAVNRYEIIPQLSPRRTKGGIGRRFFRLIRIVIKGARRASTPELAASRFAQYVVGESLLALLVLTFTGLLTEATPARHTAFERKATSHVTPAQARSGEGGARAGTVTPPEGDAAQGRALFVKLKCFACHTVPTKDIPTPIQPGPNLTDIGQRHPGYLIESIMNPNAMILDGPGYTDPQGLSTMPDYRNKLTVGELIDLVAYLRTL